MIKIRNNRRIALLLVLAMLATMCIGIGTASASTTNSVVGAIKSVADTGNVTLASVLIDEAVAGNLATNDVVSVTLPAGVEWQATVGSSALLSTANGTTTVTASMDTISAQVANVKVKTITKAGTDKAQLQIPFAVNVKTVGTGDISVNLAAPGTAIAEGSYTIGKFVSGGATVSVLSTPTKGGSDTYGTIRVVENAVSAIASDKTITVKLPKGFTWTNASFNVTGTNGRVVPVTTSDRTATLTFPSYAGINNIGIYDIPTALTVTKVDAVLGDVVASIGGTAGVTGDVTIGKYATYGATVSVKSVKDALAGKYAQKTDSITIEETVKGSILTGRDITVTVPDGVKITSVEAPTTDNFTTTRPTITDAKNYVTLTPTTPFGTAGKLVFKLILTTEADYTGDITATISGAGIDEQQVVIAKAVQPATLTTTSTDLKIGVQDQKASDIVITENAKEAIAKTYQTSVDGSSTSATGILKVSLTNGAAFADTPVVKVTKGNLELKTSQITVSDAGDYVSIPVKSESTTPSEITLSNVIITLDRTVPQGAVYAKLGGTAIVENSGTGNGQFDVGTMSKAQIANVTTPAPDNDLVNVASFVIGSSNYTLNGNTVAAVAASYAKNNRTYLAIRDVAHVLGIDDSNILWDGTNNTVTLMKGDKVVQLKLGSNVILINGAAVTMDVAVEASNGRTFLPAAFVAQAFGSSATYEAATNTVTIK